MMTHAKAPAVAAPPGGYAAVRIPDHVFLPAPYGEEKGLLPREHTPGEAPARTLMRAVVADLATRMTVQEVNTGNGEYTVCTRTGAAFQRFVFSPRFTDGFAAVEYLPRPGVQERMGLGLPAPVVSALILLWRGEEEQQALAALEAHDGAAVMAAKVAEIPTSDRCHWLAVCTGCDHETAMVRIRDGLCRHCRFKRECPPLRTLADFEGLNQEFREYWEYQDPYIANRLREADRRRARARAPRRPAAPAPLPDPLF